MKNNLPFGRSLSFRKVKMKIVADSNLLLLAETFSKHGEVILLPGREIQAEQVRDADILRGSQDRVKQDAYLFCYTY